VPVPVQGRARELPWGLVFSAMFSALTLIAFFALPFVDAVIVNYSAVQITQLASNAQFLWFTAGAAIFAFLWSLAALIAQAGNSAVRQWSGLAIVLLSIISAVPLFLVYLYLAKGYISDGSTLGTATGSPTHFLGAGFCLCVVGALGATVSGVAAAFSA
jgi:hypothetical protein